MNQRRVTLLALLLSVCFRANACPEQYSSSVGPDTPNEEARRILESKYPQSIVSIGREPMYLIASYVVGVRERIERQGRDGIPADAQGRYGSGTALVTIDADGRFLELNLLRSSGDKALDLAFLKTVCATTNYPPFVDSLRSKASFLHISLPFTYAKDIVNSNQASNELGNEPRSPGVGTAKAAHMFQIVRVAADAGEFAVISRNGATGRIDKKVIEVKTEGRVSIQVVMIRRMIGILREVEKSDFIWQSTRLNREVKLSTRPEDTIGLESFLMMEFFPNSTN